MIAPKNQRLLSLDVLRGITIAGMILVNNPGSWSYVYAPLEHAAWNGLTPTDLIFPFFMFIMGVSLFISLCKTDFKPHPTLLIKIIKRTAVIFLLGLLLNWFALSLANFNTLEGQPFFTRLINATTQMENLRIFNVLQRLALAYSFASLLVLFIRHNTLIYIITLLLIGYFLILLFGNGFVLSEESILSITDRHLFGASHLYQGTGIAFDPEGLLGTIPSIAHVLIGFLFGKMLVTYQDNQQKTLYLLIYGALLTFLGFLLSYGCPINKQIWSPTFVIINSGLAATVLALLIWFIDIKQYRFTVDFFRAFGVNPLFIYVVSMFIAILFIYIPITTNGATINLQGFIYEKMIQPIFGNYPGSLLFAFLFVLLMWLICYPLYKREIYIKI